MSASLFFFLHVKTCSVAKNHYRTPLNAMLKSEGQIVHPGQIEPAFRFSCMRAVVLCCVFYGEEQITVHGGFVQ